MYPSGFWETYADITPTHWQQTYLDWMHVDLPPPPPQTRTRIENDPDQGSAISWIRRILRRSGK